MISLTSNCINTDKNVSSSSSAFKLPFVSVNQQCYLTLPLPMCVCNLMYWTLLTALQRNYSTDFCRVLYLLAHQRLDDIYSLYWSDISINTFRTGDADLCFYITTVQDGWCKSAFLTRACFPCTVHLIMQYTEPVSEWSCWRMFIETWPHFELTFRHRASSI